MIKIGKIKRHTLKNQDDRRLFLGLDKDLDNDLTLTQNIEALEMRIHKFHASNIP